MNVSKSEFVALVAERMTQRRAAANRKKEQEYRDYRERMKDKYKHIRHIKER